MKLFRNKQKEKVFVGLSGGVDSSVSAALLKKDGYDVVGVFIKVWHPDFLPCTWEDDRRDAMLVCATLDIPFLTFDFEEEYKKEVVTYMLREYEMGRTPNPDVMCNKYVKFGAFFRKAREMGADYIATGHYARNDFRGSSFRLLVSQDKAKDQTYFLWTLPQEVLSRVLFPVGNLEKKRVRVLAKKFNLITAEKKDSQGLCFIGKIDLRSFLKHFIDSKPGSVINESGQTIGTHDGAFFYTIGQRHGFTITTNNADAKPYYITQKNIKKNLLIVSNSPETSTQNVRTVTLENVNWTASAPPKEGSYTARFRYRQALHECELSFKYGRPIISFDIPKSGISSGQSLVIYNGEECIGGGIIV